MCRHLVGSISEGSRIRAEPDGRNAVRSLRLRLADEARFILRHDSSSDVDWHVAWEDIGRLRTMPHKKGDRRQLGPRRGAPLSFRARLAHAGP